MAKPFGPATPWRLVYKAKTHLAENSRPQHQQADYIESNMVVALWQRVPGRALLWALNLFSAVALIFEGELSDTDQKLSTDQDTTKE